MKRTFNIFGQPVVLSVFSSDTHGAFSLGQQTCAPGTGVPPHLHTHEDEAFSVLSGTFELYNGDNDSWTEIPQGNTVFAPRHHVHCFRNSGDTDGVIQFVCGGAAFDVFLEGLSQFSIPEDVQAVVDYSARYGIFYPTLPPPSAA